MYQLVGLKGLRSMVLLLGVALAQVLALAQHVALRGVALALRGDSPMVE